MLDIGIIHNVSSDNKMKFNIKFDIFSQICNIIKVFLLSYSTVNKMGAGTDDS